MVEKKEKEDKKLTYKEELRDKNFQYILDYLEIQPLYVYKAVLEDKAFLEALRKKATDKGVARFEKRLKSMIGMLEERDPPVTEPTTDIETRGGEIVINGLTETESLIQSLGPRQNKTVIARYLDKVLINGFDKYAFPDGVEGTVDQVYLPVDSYTPIRYSLDIRIYDEDGDLLTIEKYCCEQKYLTLLEQWDPDKKDYITDPKEFKALPILGFGYRKWNEFEEYAVEEELKKANVSQTAKVEEVQSEAVAEQSSKVEEVQSEAVAEQSSKVEEEPSKSQMQKKIDQLRLEEKGKSSVSSASQLSGSATSTSLAKQASDSSNRPSYESSGSGRTSNQSNTKS